MLIKTKNTKKTTFPIIAFTVFLVFFIFLTNSVNVRAQGLSYLLPYNYAEYLDTNSAVYHYLGDINSAIASYSNQNFDFTDCIYVPQRVRSNVIYVYCLSDPYIDNDYSNLGTIWSNPVIVKGSNAQNSCFIVGLGLAGDGSLNSCSVTQMSSSLSISCFGQYDTETYYSSSYTYKLFYPVIYNDYIYDSVGNLIFTVGNPDFIPDEETFENLDEFLDITSTLSNTVDSAQNDINNQKGFFDNLVANLKNMFNSLKGWLYQGFNNLSQNLLNFFGPFLVRFQNYFSDIQGLIESFKDSFDHIREIFNSIYNLGLENNEFSFSKFLSVLLVPDPDELQNSLSGSVLYTLITGVINVSTSELQYWYNIFTGTQHTYVFTLPNFTFGGKTFTGLTVNFDWYLPYKSYGDGIISAFLIIGYIQFVRLYVTNLMKAGSGISVDNKEDDSYHRTNIGF